ncbi:MAG TPA: tRNA pseudouridine(55) synthase TruB [Solirubrobacteraceae bacterium]|nr:tRNA pseudouridine(55) synthase TruB [Solirubrobacteraceae bacterium]
MIPGVLLADKPAGITSHDVVARARRALDTRAIGHAGTLDPFATGLLILLIGRATRLQRFFMALPKTYEVTAQLGARSTTGDVDGEITATGRVPAEIRLPRGRIRQRPPAYSAVKVAGERAYVRARRGDTLDLPDREVEIYGWAALDRDGDRVDLRITCSAGTYIRALIAELDDAYCLALRRTAIGPFAVDGAWPAQGPAAPLDAFDACARFLPRVAAGSAPGGDDDSPALLVDPASGAPVAIAAARGAGWRVLVRAEDWSRRATDIGGE